MGISFQMMHVKNVKLAIVKYVIGMNAQNA
jgi:hypothetical protein